MYKKFIVAFVLFILLGGAVYIFVSSNDTQSNQSTNTPEMPERPPERLITERGIITCIPKIGDGPQTQECAIGLRNTEGVYFGLRYLSDHDENFALVSTDTDVEINGTLVYEEMFGPDVNRYDIVGIIEIDTISEI